MDLIDYRDTPICLPGRRVGQRALAEAARDRRLDTPKRRPLYYRGDPWALWVCYHPLSPSDTHSLSSYAFNDFGPKFTCVDPTGEQPLSGMIVSVEKVRGLLDFAAFDT